MIEGDAIHASHAAGDIRRTKVLKAVFFDIDDTLSNRSAVLR